MSLIPMEYDGGGYEIKTATLATATTGDYGNVTLGNISTNDIVLMVYCNGYIVLPRRTATAWTCVVVDMLTFQEVSNTTISNLTVVYATTS